MYILYIYYFIYKIIYIDEEEYFLNPFFFKKI